MDIRYLLVAMILGVIFPIGHEITFLVKYFIMLLLFFSFREISYNKDIFHPLQIWLLVFFLSIPLVWYIIVRNWSETYALAGFVMAIQPTASVAPVIMGYLKGKLEPVTLAILTTNCATALYLPIVLPMIIPASEGVTTPDILASVLIVILVPLFLAILVRTVFPVFNEKLNAFNRISFYLFLLNVYIAIAEATHFIRFESTAGLGEILGIGVVAVIIFSISMLLGTLAGGKTLQAEGSMALGRKNTIFGIWLGLTYMSPLVALGPMLYILVQNAYHSFLISRVK
ncbi:MAG: hypothetical protein SF052_02480 [Bacteroidia bacterium]|nr:hypothetical protein [Bacteroidia bacterium]